MSDRVLKRRLKSLAQRKADADGTARRERREADLARRAAVLGVDVELMRAIDAPPPQGEIVLPMSAYYSRDAAFEHERAIFYAHVAMIYGSAGWRFATPEMRVFAEMGYGQRGRSVKPIDQDSSVNTNIGSAPLEWLVAKSRLETRDDEHGTGMVRFAVAMRFRDTVEGGEIAGLKGQNIEDGGGGGGGGRPVSDYKIDCLKKVTEIRSSMDPVMFALLQDVICHDVWVWETTRSQKVRDEIIIRLHMAIDYASVVYGYLNENGFRRRWKVPFDQRWWEAKPKKRRWAREPLLS